MSDDNTTLVASDFGCISAWRISTGQRLFSLTDHRSTAPVCLVKRRGEVELATVLDGKVVLYNLETGGVTYEFSDKRLKAFNESSSSFYMVATEREILLAGQDGLRPGSGGWVRGLDIDTGNVVDKLTLDRNEMIHFIGVAASGTLLLAFSKSGGNDHGRRGSAVQVVFFKLQLWDAKKRTLVSKLTELTDEVRCYALSTDRTKAVTLGHSRFRNTGSVFQGEIKIFDLLSLQVQKCLLRYPSSINFIAYTDYNHMITASRDKLVRVWDLERNELNLSDEQQEREILCFFKHRVTFSEDTAINTVDFDTGDMVRFVNGVQAQVYPVDAGRVVVVSASELFLFDLVAKKMVLQFQGKTQGSLIKTCFMYDTTNLIAVGKGQQYLQVYDVSTGKLLERLTADQSSPISRFEFNSVFCEPVSDRVIL